MVQKLVTSGLKKNRAMREISWKSFTANSEIRFERFQSFHRKTQLTRSLKKLACPSEQFSSSEGLIAAHKSNNDIVFLGSKTKHDLAGEIVQILDKNVKRLPYENYTCYDNNINSLSGAF